MIDFSVKWHTAQGRQSAHCTSNVEVGKDCHQKDQKW